VSRKRSRLIIALAIASCLLAFPVIYAQTTAPPAECATALPSDAVKTAGALLDRIDRLVSAARKEVEPDDLAAVGTSGSGGASAKVTIQAADLDEIRAEIAQIKSLLQAKP
jgi:hypothetical protein